MKFAFQKVSRPLEDALGIAAFSIEIDGTKTGVVIDNGRFAEVLDNVNARTGVDLSKDDESKASVAELSHLLCAGAADFATRVRDQAEAKVNLQGHSFRVCSMCGTSAHGEVVTPFGARAISSFETLFYRTSDACEDGLPTDIGVTIMKQALAQGLQLEEPNAPSGGEGAEVLISVLGVRLS